MKIKGYVFNKTLTRVIGLVNHNDQYMTLPKIANKKRATKQIEKAEHIIAINERLVNILPIKAPEPVFEIIAKGNFWENRFTTANIFNDKLKLIIPQYTDTTGEIVELAKQHNLLYQLINNSKEKKL